MFHPLCSPVSSNPSDGFQPPRFRPWTMTPSSWWVSNDGEYTTQWIPTSSTDHFDSAISNRMTSLLLLLVFLLLSCMLFPRFLILWAASSVILLETFSNRPLQKTAMYTILYPCSLPSGLCTWGFYLHVTPHNFSSHNMVTHVALLWPASLTARTLKLPV